jgi:hypothetical protein
MRAREFIVENHISSKPRLMENRRQLNEWAFLIPAISVGVRLGAAALSRMATPQNAAKVASSLGSVSVIAGKTAGKAIIRHPGKAALGGAAAAYQDEIGAAIGVASDVYDFVTDSTVFKSVGEAMGWLKSLAADIDEPTMKALAQIVVTYGIPAAGIMAALYGGSKLVEFLKNNAGKLGLGAAAMAALSLGGKALYDYIKGVG